MVLGVVELKRWLSYWRTKPFQYEHTVFFVYISNDNDTV